ncbi:MAG: hypothetical protein EXQ87_05925 [Alphaproteobacteria bacterium]|nr:hypothetical protein [Alphaproteobacteria bacterium]
MLAVPKLRDTIGTSLPRLKAAQLTHWAILFRGQFDADYMARTRAVGLAHWRIGLEPHWFTGACLFFINRLHRLIHRTYDTDPEARKAVCEAVSTAIMLDMNLVLTAYHDAMTDALVMEKQRADEAARAKAGFLAHMSHEFRTPLNAILGFGEMLQGRYHGPLTAKQAEYATDIHDAANHLLALINGVLDMATIEANQLDLHEEAVDLAELVRESCNLVAGQASAAGVTIATGGVHGAAGL